MKAAMPAPDPFASYTSWKPARARSAAAASGSTGISGGSCATSVTTSPGWAATSASAVTAPPLLANSSTGPAPSASITACTSSGLDGGRVVGPAVVARAAAEAARVVGDDGAVREMRRQRAEAARVHRLADHQQRRAAVRGGQRAADVVDDLGAGCLEVCVVMALGLLPPSELIVTRAAPPACGR